MSYHVNVLRFLRNVIAWRNGRNRERGYRMKEVLEEGRIPGLNAVVTL
jgi:hypothetical protein